MDEFIERIELNKKEGKQWAKAEAYFTHLTEPKTLLSRLKVRQFSNRWKSRLETCEEMHDHIAAIYEVLNEDKYFYEMLRYILECGNVLNGNNNKRGQADGFDIDKVVDKVHSFKGNDDSSLL